MYLPTMALQTRIFLLSIGLGFSLGILYDIFYITRLTITKSKYAIYIQDFVYLLSCSFITFIFILALSSGVVRGYILIGEFLGWLIYYLSTGYFVVSFATRAVNFIKTTFKKMYELILRPFKWIAHKIYKISKRSKLFVQKKCKKINKKFKMHLKLSRNVVYNTIDVIGENAVSNEGNDKV